MSMKYDKDMGYEVHHLGGYLDGVAKKRMGAKKLKKAAPGRVSLERPKKPARKRAPKRTA